MQHGQFRGTLWGCRARLGSTTALRAERATADIPADGRRLATEQLDAYMTIFSDTAMRFREAGDLDQFREWAALAIEAARILAPYQSPRLTAVAIGAPAWRLVVHARDQLNGPIS